VRGIPQDPQASRRALVESPERNSFGRSRPVVVARQRDEQFIRDGINHADHYALPLIYVYTIPERRMVYR